MTSAPVDTMTRDPWTDFVRWAWLSGEPCHRLLSETEGEADKAVVIYEYGRCELAAHIGWKHKPAKEPQP